MKITLKVGKKELQLSEEEARELYNDLAKMYSQPIIYPITYPVPIYVERQTQPYWSPYTTCSSISSSVDTLSDEQITFTC